MEKVQGTRSNQTSASSPSMYPSTTSSSPTTSRLLRGKTSEGRLFFVPSTKHVFASVFGEVFSTSKKMTSTNVFDITILSVLACHIALFFTFNFTKYFYLCLFLFWRCTYNLGLGWLLKSQSETKSIVSFLAPFLDPKRNSETAQFLKKELGKKLDSDYQFDNVPIEFNVWILFRSLVDLILIHDFTSYIMFTLAFWETPTSYGINDVLRILAGTLILLFNLWVKMDAHRVVKDFAWYWGDFFFLLDNPLLTFDGVFEMAPHPMYSVGYAGYYGMSLMTGSYTVLYVSLVAHLGQFLFLTLVENPHIEKTYGQDRFLSDHIFSNPESGKVFQSYFSRNLNILFFKNWDIFRTTDLFSLVISIYAMLAGMFCSPPFAAFQALAWIVFHTYVLGFILYQQSRNKMWTRHFIKFGWDNHCAFEHWKAAYNLSIGMLYVTFIIAAIRYYTIPMEWHSQATLFRHVLGCCLIGLHIWTSKSVYEVLGDFGFFYGDFFIDEIPVTLFYTGIYRFINNPEKIMGHAAFWGITLMSGSWVLFFITLFSQLSNFLFIRFVEQPHLTSLYGDEVRQEAGWERAVKKVTVPVKSQWVDPVHHHLENLGTKVSEFILIHLPPRSSQFQQVLDIYQLFPSTPSPLPWNQPVRLFVQAPGNHGKRDWVGIYPMEKDAMEYTHPLSTSIQSSNGVWKYWNNSQTTPSEDSTIPQVATRYDIFFDILKPGKYEARLHYDDSHTVLAVAHFEIEAPMSLHDVLAYAIGMDQVHLPWTTEQVKKIADIVSKVYQVEFHFEVISQFGTLETLEVKIQEALAMLFPPTRFRKNRSASLFSSASTH